MGRVCVLTVCVVYKKGIYMCIYIILRLVEKNYIYMYIIEREVTKKREIKKSQIVKKTPRFEKLF